MPNDQEFRDEVLIGLTELRAGMKSLIGNGQPGRVQTLEEKVNKLENFKAKALGIVTGISLVIGAISAIIHFVFRY